ncbi:peptide deformylase [Legionella spiritensis]|uniref:peptide deformylase n=1 Tax=Legionella spiritensis TaxID=452 RepID=UPI000F6E6112|nr:peptide deformylase [Legionella spiritensis]VEG90944.1 polypeptide deformylase [Legionella spiritensis]
MTLPASVHALNIVTIEQSEYQHVLKTPAQIVRFPLSNDDRTLIKAMKEKLCQLHGVGLAAPQVNQSRQIIVIYIPEDAALLRDNVTPYPIHVLCNPAYEAIPGSAVKDDFEGCYSVAGKAGKVPRYERIKLSYYDEHGQRHERVEQGFYARVLQHEIDHLNGILIIDRLTPNCVQGSIEEMNALRRAELSEEKRKLFDQLMATKLKK